MTVINAMTFDDKSGGMVTDSQSSTSLRRYDIAEKLTSIEGKNGTRVLVGGAGVTSILYETTNELKKKFADDNDFKIQDVANYISFISTKIGRELIDKEMLNRFGFGVNEYISGRLSDGTPLNSHVLEPAKEIYHGNLPQIQNLNQNGYLVVGADENGSSLIQMELGCRPFFKSTPYASIGSGDDESDKALYEFVSNLPREKRHSIDRFEGMMALLSATNRSGSFNQGVGGIPTVAQFERGKDTIILEENPSLLATEIVKVKDKGLITTEESIKGLTDLLTRNRNHLEIEQELFLGKQNANDIVRFLRGYQPNGK